MPSRATTRTPLAPPLSLPPLLLSVRIRMESATPRVRAAARVHNALTALERFAALRALGRSRRATNRRSSANGYSARCTPPATTAQRPCQTGSSTTTHAGRIARSAGAHPSATFTTSRGRTPRWPSGHDRQSHEYNTPRRQGKTASASARRHAQANPETSLPNNLQSSHTSRAEGRGFAPHRPLQYPCGIRVGHSFPLPSAVAFSWPKRFA